MPWLLSGSKLTKQPATLLDLCYGKTNNLNLQQVVSPLNRCLLGNMFHLTQSYRSVRPSSVFTPTCDDSQLFFLGGVGQRAKIMSLCVIYREYSPLSVLKFSPTPVFHHSEFLHTVLVATLSGHSLYLISYV